MIVLTLLLAPALTGHWLPRCVAFVALAVSLSLQALTRFLNSPGGTPVSAHAYRYGSWAGGRDPLEPPYDVASALDEIGEAVLDGPAPGRRCATCCAAAPTACAGLDDLRRQVAKRQRQARQKGQLDGTLQEVRELLDRALEAERRELFPDPSDAARMRELELDTLPHDTARAVQALKPTTSGAAPRRAQAYEQIDDLLRREVLDSQFKGMKEALESASPGGDAGASRTCSPTSTRCCEADARGEHTQEQFDDVHGASTGSSSRRSPQTLEELVDDLARRAAAQQRLMDSLTPQQRQELGELMQGAMDLDLAAQMAQLGDSLRNARPDLPWGGRGADARRAGHGHGRRAPARSRSSPTSTTSRRRSARTTPAPRSTTSTRPPCSARSAGRAVDDVAALRRIERELHRAGLPRPRRQRPARAVARGPSAASARPRCARCSPSSTRAAAAGTTSATRAPPARPPAPSRAWEFGDEQPLDVVRTVRNAVLRVRRRRPVRAARSTTSRSSRPSAARSACRRAARRPVVLDGAARHLGHGQADGARAALARHDEVPAGRDRDHRLQRLRAGADAGEAGRPGRAARAGHQPAARAGAGRPAPRQAPRQRAGRPGRHRRRADRPPDPRRATPSSAGRRCPRRSS